MRKAKNAVVTALGIIGVCALGYLVWQGYQHSVEEAREHAIISGSPAVPGMPDFRKPSTAPPPPQ